MTASGIAFALGAAFGALLASSAAAGIGMRARRALAAPIHELRGGLAAIQLGLYALDRRALAPSGERVDALRTQAERASLALEDVDALRLGRRPGRNVELVEIGELVRRRARAWEGLASARRRSVQLRWPLGPAIVRVDSGRLAQALDNLIVNGIDHGRGVVTVTGALGNGVVRIAVSDEGLGLNRSIAEASRAPWHARHGHGLAIAARAAELNGGRLIATASRIASRIEIEIPLAEPDAARRTRAHIRLAGRDVVPAGSPDGAS